ncbi:hypothetical protein BGZ76_002463 [Entomortierella beljakovae]|nr:hypothetical protein BGZ76_002463 [Entomortierella beljakovae]
MYLNHIHTYTFNNCHTRHHQHPTVLQNFNQTQLGQTTVTPLPLSFRFASLELPFGEAGPHVPEVEFESQKRQNYRDGKGGQHYHQQAAISQNVPSTGFKSTTTFGGGANRNILCNTKEPSDVVSNCGDDQSFPCLVSKFYIQQHQQHQQQQQQQQHYYDLINFQLSSNEYHQSMNRTTFGDTSLSHATPSLPLQESTNKIESSENNRSDTSSGWAKLPILMRRHSYIDPLTRLVRGRQQKSTEASQKDPVPHNKSISKSKSISYKNSAAGANALGGERGAERQDFSISTPTPISTSTMASISIPPILNPPSPLAHHKTPKISTSNSFQSLGPSGSHGHGHDYKRLSEIKFSSGILRRTHATMSQVSPHDQSTSSPSSSVCSEGPSSELIYVKKLPPLPPSGVDAPLITSHAHQLSGERDNGNEISGLIWSNSAINRPLPKPSLSSSSSELELELLSSSADRSTMIENEIEALRQQINKSSMVLTHIVQTKTVPNPTALLGIILGIQQQQKQQPQPQPQQQQDKPKNPSSSSKSQSRPHSPLLHQHSDSGCSCGLLEENDSGNFGKGREVAFLAACYCPDPWEFQGRVLRQIEFMQHDIQILKQEKLEIEKRTTICIRHEMLEKERARDREWVELNERLNNLQMIVEGGGGEGGGEEEQDDDVEVEPRNMSCPDFSKDDGIQGLDGIGEGIEDWEENREADVVGGDCEHLVADTKSKEARENDESKENSVAQE